MPDNNRKQIRNPIARAAILRKGGVHDKSNKAKRQKHKQSFKKDIRAGKFGSYLFSSKCSGFKSFYLTCQTVV